MIATTLLVIVDGPTKIIHYKLVKITIDALGQAKVIINVLVHYHRVSESIITD